MRKILGLLTLAFAAKALADTPPQIINKVCAPSTWLYSIVPGQAPLCSQPQISDVFGLQAALDGKQPTGNYITALTGDVAASGPGSATATLANSGVSAGSYTYSAITVDAKGRVTAASSGTAPPAVPISLANGGFGESGLETTVTTTGIINALSAPTRFIRFNPASGVTLNGMVAPTGSEPREKILFNANTSLAIAINYNSASASAGNRFFPAATGSSYSIPALGSLRFIYSSVGATSGWMRADEPIMVTSPLFRSGATRAIEMPPASPSTGGYTTSAKYNEWTAKLGPDGLSADAVVYSTNGTSLDSDASKFSYDESQARLGVGVSKAQQLASFHVKSTGSTSVGPPTISVELIQFTPLSDVTSASANTYQPYMDVATDQSATPNYSGTGYTADNNTIDYRIIYATDLGEGVYRWGIVVAQATSTDDGSTNPYSVDISWSNNDGAESRSVIFIQRQINGGGYGDYVSLDPSSTGFSDDNTAWTGGEPNHDGGDWPDLVADGSTFSFDAYSQDTSPIPLYPFVYSSNPYNYGYSDSANGRPYRIQHDISGGGPNYRTLKDSSSHYDSSSGFIQDANTFSGDATVTPNNLGYVSDGSTLNRSYFGNSRLVSGVTIYSADSVDSSTSDPSDGNTYYIKITGTAIANGLKIRRYDEAPTFTGSYTYASSGSYEVYDDGIVNFGGDETVTPTSVPDPAAYFEGKGTSSADPAAETKKSIDGSYYRIEYISSAGAVLNTYEVTASGANIGQVLSVGFPTAVTAASRANNTLFRDSATGKLSFKDNSGVTHALY